jgi:hypothetical protein
VRRATAALLGTVAGTALLVGAKYGSGPASATAVTSAAAPLGPDPSGAGSPPAGGAATGGAGGTVTGGTPVGGNAAPAAGGGAPAGTTPTRATGGGAPPARSAPPPPPACTTATGNPVNVARPGIGAVTVTIKVCNGAITSSTGSLSQSDWSRNTSAIPALNSLSVQYYKTSFAQIHYSGASLTSNAYQASLRSAMAAAKI